MQAIDRKLVRDLWNIKGQVIAITAVIACGVAMFVMSLSTLASLQQTRDAYYDRYRFAHVFASLKRAPDTLVARLRSIPGVAQLQTRIVQDVTLDVQGMEEPAVGRLLSVPDRRAPQLNDLFLREGRYLQPGRAGEVLVSESFALAHGLGYGDTLHAVINGKKQRLRIVGIALSPEYVLQMAPGSLLPDDRRFGIFWMGETDLEAAFDMDGAFNNLTLRLMRGASEPEVIARLDALLAPYGSVGAHGRMDQLSHRYLSEEINQLRSMGLIAPSIFLSVAAFLLNVVLSRIVRSQREEIAALKAFGYTRWAIGVHYFKLVLLIALIGDGFGIVIGAWLGRGLTEMYTLFYKFPVFGYQLPPHVICLAIGISFAAAALGTWASVRSAVRLAPAEAMRPEPPASYRPTLVERLGIGGWFSPAARMILRNLQRQPFKAAMSSVGIALAVAVLIMGSFTKDSLDYLMDVQFFVAQRQDLSVYLVQPTTRDALHEMLHLPGVLHGETFRSVPTRMRFEHRHRRVGLSSVDRSNRLYRLLDEQQNEVRPASGGILLSQKLAELLGAELHDVVTVEVLEGQRPTRSIPVTGIVKEMSGANAYMDTEALRVLLREDRLISGAHLQVDTSQLEQLYRTLKATPQVASVSVKIAAVRSFNETISENLLRFQMFNVTFASIIAFGVVYNSARISLAERSRELATLRVIGFTRAEISLILLGELGLVTVAAIPLGMAIGYLFAWWASHGLDNELFQIPMVINRSTYAFATLVVLIASTVSGLSVRSQLDRLDLVAVLKTKE